MSEPLCEKKKPQENIGIQQKRTERGNERTARKKNKRAETEPSKIYSRIRQSCYL